MATSAGDAKDGKAFYGYLFAKSKPIPAPTPVFDALLRAIALHIVRRSPGQEQDYSDDMLTRALQANEIGDKSEEHLTPAKLAAFYKSAGHEFDCE